MGKQTEKAIQDVRDGKYEPPPARDESVVGEIASIMTAVCSLGTVNPYETETDERKEYDTAHQTASETLPDEEKSSSSWLW
jgi:hypothetical protein